MSAVGDQADLAQTPRIGLLLTRTVVSLRRGIQVILDLNQRKVLLAAQNGTTRPIFPIVNASAR